jgi:hypothetical protein
MNNAPIFNLTDSKEGKIKDPRIYFWVRSSWPSFLYVARTIIRRDLKRGKQNGGEGKSGEG